MKTTLLFLFCLLGAVTALGQAVAGGSALSSTPHVPQFYSRAEHASRQDLARGQSLLPHPGFAWGKGERPLWEVASPAREIPMGDVARALRKQHAEAKKAVRVWED